jgi:hypothetical protein
VKFAKGESRRHQFILRFIFSMNAQLRGKIEYILRNDNNGSLCLKCYKEIKHGHVKVQGDRCWRIYHPFYLEKVAC